MQPPLPGTVRSWRIADVQLKPKIPADRNELVKRAVVTDEPRRNDRHEQRRRYQPSPKCCTEISALPPQYPPRRKRQERQRRSVAQRAQTPYEPVRQPNPQPG